MTTLAEDPGRASLKPPLSGRHPSKYRLQGYHFLGVLPAVRSSWLCLEKLWPEDTILLSSGIQWSPTASRPGIRKGPWVLKLALAGLRVWGRTTQTALDVF